MFAFCCYYVFLKFDMIPSCGGQKSLNIFVCFISFCFCLFLSICFLFFDIVQLFLFGSPQLARLALFKFTSYSHVYVYEFDWTCMLLKLCGLLGIVDVYFETFWNLENLENDLEDYSVSGWTKTARQPRQPHGGLLEISDHFKWFQCFFGWDCSKIFYFLRSLRF